MRRLLLLLAALPAFGAVTASPTSLSVPMRQGTPFPWIATMYPQQPAANYSYPFAITGTGSWTAVLTGTLSTACSGPCLTITPASGTGNGTVSISYFASGAELLTAGTTTGTLTIGSTAVSLSVVVTAANPYMSFVYPATYPSGCTNSNSSGYSFQDTCTVTNERPPSTSFSIPSACGSYTDPQFGHTVKRMTPAGNNLQYSSVTAFSATNKYVLTGTLLGVANIYRVSDCALVYANVSGVNLVVAWWDPNDDEAIWYFASGVLKHLELNTMTLTTAANYSSASGSRPALSDANTSNGTTDITDDGYLAVETASNNAFCAINLNGLTTSNQESQIVCNTNASGGMGGGVNYVDMARGGVDSVSGKRYFEACGNGLGAIYSVHSSSLTFEFNIPQGIYNNNSCQHHSLAQLPDGEIVWYGGVATTGNQNYIITALLNKGTSMYLPVEIGGGLAFLYNANNQGSSEFGCNSRGFCIESSYEYPGVSNWQIASITPGSPCSITTTAVHGLGLVGATPSVLIGGAMGSGGITGINNVTQTATVTGTTTFTIPTCSGTYTPNTGTVVLNQSTSSGYPLRNELIVAWLGHGVYRIAETREKMWADNNPIWFYYTEVPMGSLSRDGSYVSFVSNMGIPEQSSVYIAQTGLGSSMTAGSLVGGNIFRGGNSLH